MENSERLSKTGYWEKYIKGKGIMSRPTFMVEFDVLLADEEFKAKFGDYCRRRKLSSKQIEMLNNELIN